MPLSESVKKIAREKKISLASIAKSLGISPQNLNTKLTRENPSFALTRDLARILNVEVNQLVDSDAVFDKDGDENLPIQGEKGLIINNLIQRTSAIPYYDIEVFGGDIAEWDEEAVVTPTTYYFIPKYSGCIAVKYFGKSMIGRYEPGQILFLKPISDYILIDFGEAYVVELADSRRVAKYIRKHPEKGWWILRSHNPEYDDMEIPLGKIKRVYWIAGSMSDNGI